MTYQFREYPKWIAGPDGPVIAANAEAERALIGGTPPPVVETPAIDRYGPPDSDCDGTSSGTEHTVAFAPATTWRSSQAVVTKQDHYDRAVRKRERVLSLQRERRRSLPRVDYYPSRHALQVIDWLTAQWGGSVGSTLDRIVVEWGCHSGIKG